MKVSDIEILMYNPFHLSKVLHHFISGALSVNDAGVKSELIYLALPFILNDKVNNKLQSLNKKSKFTSILEYRPFEIFLSQINSRIGYTKKKTKYALIVLANTTTVNISNFISVEEPVNYKTEKDLELRPIYKAAYILGTLIAKERYLTVMHRLKIVEL